MNSLAKIENCKKLCDKYALAGMVEKLELLKNIRPQVNVALLGEYSVGKTMLLKALTGNEYFPTFERPTTAVLTKVKSGTEDKITVYERSNDGKRGKRTIQPYQLADEIIKYEDGKEVEICLRDSSLLDDNIVIIDTPGLSSVETNHDFVSMKYVMEADAAFILINPNIGATSTFMNSIGIYPRELLENSYFVINFKDQMSEENLSKVLDIFREDISKIVSDPKIISISAIDGFNAKKNNDQEAYVKSGVSEIEKIIKQDIMQIEEDIQERKRNEDINSILRDLKLYLQERIKSADLGDEEIEKRINTCRDDIDKLNSEIRKIKIEFDRIKNRIIEKVDRIIENNIESIFAVIGERDDTGLEEIIKKINTDIDNTIKTELEKIKDIKIDDAEFGQEFANLLSRFIADLNAKVELVGGLLTFAIIMILIPGSKLLLESLISSGMWHSSKKKGKGKRSILDEFLDKFNITDLLNQMLIKPAFKRKFMTDIKDEIETKINSLIEDLENNINNSLEQNQKEKIRMSEQALRQAREEKEADVEKAKEEIAKDIKTVTEMEGA